MRPKKDAEEKAPAAVMNRAWDLSMYRYAGRDNAPAPTTPEFSNGGLVGITNQVEAELPPGEPVVPAETIAAMTRDELFALIREAVQAQAATPAEEADPEDVTEEPVDPEDAKKKKLPPFLQPKKDDDEEEEPDDTSEEEPTASAEETPPAPPVEDAPTASVVPETNDEWSGLVARLTDTPSPSADDAFQSLKEAWL